MFDSLICLTLSVVKTPLPLRGVAAEEGTREATQDPGAEVAHQHRKDEGLTPDRILVPPRGGQRGSIPDPGPVPGPQRNLSGNPNQSHRLSLPAMDVRKPLIPGLVPTPGSGLVPIPGRGPVPETESGLALGTERRMVKGAVLLLPRGQVTVLQSLLIVVPAPPVPERENSG